MGKLAYGPYAGGLILLWPTAVYALSSYLADDRDPNQMWSTLLTNMAFVSAVAFILILIVDLSHLRSQVSGRDIDRSTNGGRYQRI